MRYEIASLPPPVLGPWAIIVGHDWGMSDLKPRTGLILLVCSRHIVSYLLMKFWDPE